MESNTPAPALLGQLQSRAYAAKHDWLALDRDAPSARDGASSRVVADVAPRGAADRKQALERLIMMESEGFCLHLWKGFSVVDTIDIIIEHEEFPKLWRQYRQACEVSPVQGRPIPFSTRFKGAAPDVREVLVAAEPLLHALVAATAKLGGNPGWLEVDTSPSQQAESPLWFMDDAKVPTDVAEGLLAAIRSVVAIHMLDIHHLMELPQPYAIELATCFVDNLRAYLRLLASIPSIADEVPDNIIPPDERLNLAALLDRQRTVLKIADEFRASH